MTLLGKLRYNPLIAASRLVRRMSPLFAMFVFSLMSLNIAIAQSSAKVPSVDQEDKAARFFPAFAQQAEGLPLQSAGDAIKMQWVQEPLMRFTVSDRIFGSVFLWLDSDHRPAVIGTIGSLLINGKDEGFSELHLLASSEIEPVLIEGKQPKRWAPIPLPETEPIVGAAPVSAAVPSRLSQMRMLARTYSVQMTDPQNRPAELRLLPQPLYRYGDPTVNRDGAIFAFVWTEGTDPELLLRIESRLVDAKPTWCMQPLRFTWRKLKLLKDGQELWEGKELVTRDRPHQTTPYITTLTSEMK